jgi:dipeptidyl aminopeptidase/acylaminoacyl peptidase
MSATEQELDRQARELLAPLEDVPAVAVRERPVGSPRPVLVGVLGLALLLAAIALIVAGHRQTSAPALPSGAPSIVYARAGAIYRARADGSDPTRIATGRMPMLSPDGTRVAFVQGNRRIRGGTRVLVVSSAGGAARRLWIVPAVSIVSLVAWAGNGHLVVVPDMGLFSIDVASGRQTPISGDMASGAGVGISPDGTRVAWAEAGRGGGIGIAPIDGSRPAGIVHREPSVAPLWGARGIVYATVGPNWKLWLLDTDGRGRRLLLRPRTPLLPVAISADGSRLLAERLPANEGQVVAVDVPSGRVRALTPPRFGVAALALSRDGQTAYVRTSGCGRTGRPGVVIAMPWAGGPQHVVARGTCTVSAR